MAQLPIPELDSTLNRFMEWLKPLADEKVLQASEHAVKEFASKIGPELQRKLHAFAAEKSPDSWLIDAWREQNLANRDSLPLSTNVAMHIKWRATQTGLKRVAHFANALIQVHADYRSCQSIKINGGRGEPMCNIQQRILSGGSRRPAAEMDTYIFNDPTEPANHIVILCKGYAWRVTVLDDKGSIATPAQLDNVIHRILNAYEQEAEIAFTAPSFLPAKQACEIRAQLICRSENSDAWQCIERALFVLSLDETHYSDTDTAITDTLFNDGSGIWAYKPLNYRCYINDDRYYVHFEHTWTDAGNILDIIACAQAHYDAQDCPRKNQLDAELNLTPLEWHIGEQTRLLLKEQLAEYVRRAESLRIRHHEFMMSDEEQQLLAPYSKDAICQILLQYAQYATFNTIRSTYEAVDMRHYAAGRTECLRPVSTQSVTFVKALYDNRANMRQFNDFITEHKNRVKACKRGEGVHRHLLGLLLQAKQADLDVPFFTDVGYKLLSEDFFSTTTLGTDDVIGHIVFAPTCQGGFGINYGVSQTYLSFVIIYQRTSSEHVAKLFHELESGLKHLLMLLREQK